MRWIWPLLLATPVAAQDGLYVPAFATGAVCEYTGGEGGAIRIDGTTFDILEGSCELTNPVAVRDMDATLYDAVCMAEGTPYSERMMILRTATGISLVRNGGAANFTKCN